MIFSQLSCKCQLYGIFRYLFSRYEIYSGGLWDVQGVPRNMTVARVKTTWKSSLNFIFIFDIQSSTYLDVWLLKQKLHNSHSAGVSKMWSAFFELSILPETLRILFRFRNLKKMFSGNIESTKKRQTTFWKFQD